MHVRVIESKNIPVEAIIVLSNAINFLFLVKQRGESDSDIVIITEVRLSFSHQPIDKS